MREILERVLAGEPVDLPDIDKEWPLRLVYVRDVAACISLVHRASKNQHLVYYIDEKNTTTWGEIAEIINEFVPGSTITFGPGGRQPPRELHLFPEDLNAASEFEFKTKYGIKEGLQELIEWYQSGRP